MAAIEAAQQKVSEAIIQKRIDAGEFPYDDPRAIEILAMIHAVIHAKYRIEPASGRKVFAENAAEAAGYLRSKSVRASAKSLWRRFVDRPLAGGNPTKPLSSEDFLEAIRIEVNSP